MVEFEAVCSQVKFVMSSAVQISDFFFFLNRNEPKSFESLIVKNKTTKMLDQTLFDFVQSL